VSRDRFDTLSNRTDHIESEALSIQEAQRAEVATYQERIVKIMQRNKEVTIDTIEAATKASADRKVDAAAELKAELAELEQLEQQIVSDRTTHEAKVAEVNHARSSQLTKAAQEIKCESILRVHHLDKIYATRRRNDRDYEICTRHGRTTRRSADLDAHQPT
jgi:hypothetical protein